MMNFNNQPQPFTFFKTALSRLNATQRNATQRNATQRKFNWDPSVKGCFSGKRCSLIVMTFVSLFTSLAFEGFSQVNETNSVNNSYKKLLTPPSPNAASLFKFDDIPVSGHTGTPSVNIPLVTVKGKYLSHTFALSYHASGVKVNEVASSVGLGWALQGGNVISRVVEGKPDEKSFGYASNAPFETIMNQVEAGTLPLSDPSVRSAIRNAYLGTYDSKPDIFSFNTGGYSGKFFYSSGGTIVTTPHQDVKITRVSQIFEDEGATAKAYWKVLLPNGVSYFYGGDYADVSQNENSCSPDSELPVTTSWFLKAIVHPYGEKILFKYNQQSYNYAAHRTQISYGQTQSEGGGDGDDCPSCPLEGDKTCDISKGGQEFNISEVNTIYEKLTFKYSNREDLITSKLDSVSWYGLSNAYLGKWQMTYGYFVSLGSPVAEHLKRLKLTQVQQFGANNATIPPHVVSYLDETVDESFRLPPRLGSQDHWGYANGEGEGSLLPYTYSNRINRTVQATINREPNASRMKAGSIKEIIYPAGGKSVFEFEPHNLRLYDDFVTTQTSTSNAIDVQLVENTVTYAIPTFVKIACSFLNTIFVGDVAGASVVIKNINGEILFSEGSGNIETTILLPAGTYKFIAQSTRVNERAKLIVKWSNTIPNSVPKIYGGLRIRKIQNYESNAVTQPTTTVYKYNYGKLAHPFRYFKSDKIYLLCDENPDAPFGLSNRICNTHYISSDNTGYQKTFSGSHIGYSEVEVWKGEYAEGGKSIMSFLLNQSYNQGFQTGLLTSQIDYKNQNGSFVEIKKLTNDYDFRQTKTVNNKMRRGYDIFGKLPAVYSDLSILSYLTPAYYPVQSFWYYLKASETTQDGITTRVENTFDETNGAHTQAIKTETTSSDNKVFKVESDYTWLRDNVLAPTQSKAYNGTTLIGGSKNEYKDFTNASGHIKALQWRWSNFDRNDNTIIRAVVPDDGYNADGIVVKIRETGYSIDQVYGWTNGLLTSKNFGTLNWYYDYYQSPSVFARQVRTVTDENGLRTKYTYDAFMRLLKTENRFTGTDINNPQDVQATTLYNYHYKGQPATNASDVNQNFVGTTSTFKGVTAPLSTKQYLDGLGRPMEVVKELYTPSSLHQKNYVSYDELGRQNKTYLPFESSTLGFEAASTSLSVHPRVETFFEASPLSRPIRQKNVDLTNTYISYGANIATDAVQIMVPVTTTLPVGVLASASSPNVYGINTLYKTTMTDENGKLTCVFKDKLGRVILTRKLLNGNSGANVDTYNVYDDYGQLVVVVPPGALTLGTNNSASVVNELTFQYKYDNKNRLSAKKVPSAAVQKFYYDSRDLLVLTQDGNMAAESATKHLATLYDDIGRVVKTGFVTASPTEGADYVLTDAQITDKLTETQYYANSTWVKHQGAKVLKSAGITTPTNFVWAYTERRAGLTYTGNPVWQGKQHLRYPSVSQLPITDNDTYGVDWSVSGYNGMQQPDLTIRYLFEGGAGEVRTWQNFTYDNGRRLTDVKYNYTTGGASIAPATFTLSNMVYNFKDQLIEKNIGLNGANTGALQSIDYTYNVRGWLTNINNVTLNNNGGTPNSIMTPQSVGSSPIQNLAITPFIHKAVQDAVRPYRAANANELPPLLNDGNNVDLFSQNITYGDPATQSGATPQYNGNISSTTWQVLGRAKQAYGFAYDGLDRLTNANYFDITDQTVAPFTSQYSTDNKFKEQLTYDIRGNITSLLRKGFKNGSWTANNYTAGEYDVIDNLQYSYDQPSSGNINKSNTLLRVTDNALANKGFKFVGSRPAASDSDYGYDANGNVIYDRHKNITNIQYNYLNLPMKITFGSVSTDDYGELYFVYDATGQKHQKIAYIYAGPDIEDIQVTDYVNGVEYVNSYLNRISHTEGSVVREWVSGNPVYNYEYVLRDHLGNTRVTFTDVGKDGTIDATDIKQINNYYPFGLNMEGNWQGGLWGQNKYQYNGKELNQDFGLDWNDYGARFYDAAIGRFPNADPSSDLAPDWTPYRYAFNNPLTFIDPDGLFETEAAAKAYAKEHSIKTGFFRPNQIVEQKDGTYAIENRKESTSTSNDSQFGVMTAALHVERGVHLADIGSDKAAELTDISSESYNPNAVLKNDWADRFYAAASLLQWAAPSAASAQAAIMSISKTVGRGFASFEQFKAVFGAAGKGKAWHHIVEQGGSNVAKFGAQTIHNTENLIVLDHGKGSIHAQVSGYYSSKQAFTNGQTVRQWLSTQSFQQQYDFGIKILKQHGWTP